MQYGKIITKLGYDARFQDFKVQNIVGSTDVKFPIRLEGLAYGHAIFASVSPLFCSYQMWYQAANGFPCPSPMCSVPQQCSTWC